MRICVSKIRFYKKFINLYDCSKNIKQNNKYQFAFNFEFYKYSDLRKKYNFEILNQTNILCSISIYLLISPQGG